MTYTLNEGLIPPSMSLEPSQGDNIGCNDPMCEMSQCVQSRRVLKRRIEALGDQPHVLIFNTSIVPRFNGTSNIRLYQGSCQTSILLSATGVVVLQKRNMQTGCKIPESNSRVAGISLRDVNIENLISKCNVSLDGTLTTDG